MAKMKEKEFNVLSIKYKYVVITYICEPVKERCWENYTFTETYWQASAKAAEALKLKKYSGAIIAEITHRAVMCPVMQEKDFFNEQN